MTLSHHFSPLYLIFLIKQKVVQSTTSLPSPSCEQRYNKRKVFKLFHFPLQFMTCKRRGAYHQVTNLYIWMRQHKLTSKNTNILFTPLNANLFIFYLIAYSFRANILSRQKNATGKNKLISILRLSGVAYIMQNII